MVLSEKVNRILENSQIFGCFTKKYDKTVKNDRERGLGKMLKNEREQEILQLLREKEGLVTVRSICETLYASESSVRRDLRTLEDRGLIRRVHGGAEIVNCFSNVIAFQNRTHHNREAKRRIAQKAAALVGEGDVLFLDQSSTSFYLANELLNKPSITVVTNNIEIISLLSNTDIHTVSSGGALSRENRNCLIGGDAQYIFEHTHADWLFFSAKSLSADGGIWDCTREEVVVRNSVRSRSIANVPWRTWIFW